MDSLRGKQGFNDVHGTPPSIIDLCMPASLQPEMKPGEMSFEMASLMGAITGAWRVIACPRKD
jgi:hypothetical protein